MNRNTKRRAKALSKEIAALHRAGRKVVSPPSKRRSKRKGSPSSWRLVSSVHGFHN
jgi:hypothetical protein